MKNFITILFFFIGSCNSFAQNQAYIDSLKNEISFFKEDTTTVKLLNNIAKQFIHSSPDSMFKYADKALHLSIELNYPLGKAKAYRMIGLSYSGKSEYDNALSSYFLSIKEAESINNYDYIAIVYTSIGIIYRKQSEYDEALKYYLKSLEIIKTKGDSARISSALNNVGIIYKLTGNYDNAIQYYSESLSICKRNGNREGMAYTLGNIGLIHKKKGEHEKSISYLKKALVIFEEFNFQNMIAHVYTNLGEIYLLQKRNQESFNSIQKANKIYSETENKAGRAETYLILGNIYMNQKKYFAAQSAFSLGLEISQEIGFKEYIIDSYFYLSKLDSAKNNYKQALINYKKYTHLKDSVFSLEKNSAISEIQGMYDIAEKERENIILRKNKEINEIQLHKQATRNYFTWALAGLLIIMVFSVALVFFREKKTNKILNQKNDEILAQNITLEEHKEKITEQYNELNKYRNHLEKRVSKRTIKLRKALNEAKKSDKLKTEFLLNLSHEIRTPINAISGFSEIILNDKNNFKNKHLISIQKSMDDLINTIDRLVIFSKLQVGGYKVNIDKINLSVFLENLETKIFERRNFLNKTDIDLDFIIDYNVLPKYFYSDTYIITNTIYELIENAFKFTNKGKITIKAKVISPNTLSVGILDTGMGIEKEAIPHVFDFLRKFDNENELFRGMGVGLALVKKSLEVLSGTIKMNSIPYEGAEFIIMIPESKEN